MPAPEDFRRWRDRWQPSEDEERILDGLALGLSDREVAERLSLTPESVRWQVAQMLAGSGMGDRDALADWWRLEARRPSAVLLLPHRLITSGPAAVVTVLAATAVLLVLLLASEAAPDSATPATMPSDLVERADAIRQYLVALPLATPDARRQAWVLDIDAREARTVPFYPPGSFSVLGFARWVEDGRTIFGTWAAGVGAVAGVIDISGRLLFTGPSTVPPVALPPPFNVMEPLHGGLMAIWRMETNTVTLLDPRTLRETPLIALGNPDRERMVEMRASPHGERLLLMVFGSDGARVELVDVSSGNVRVLFSGSHPAIVCCAAWSPDGGSVMFLAGSGQRIDPRFFFEHRVVVDLDGRVLLEQPLPEELRGLLVVRWAGPGVLFESTEIVESASGLVTRGRLMNVRTGVPGQEHVLPGRVDCFAPSGRYAVLRPRPSELPAQHIVWDVEVGRSVFEVTLDALLGHCDWTGDERLVILSNGG